MKKGTLTSSLLLFLTATIWGMAFVAQSVGMDYMGPMTFNGIRFLMGGIVLLPLVLIGRKKKRKAEAPGRTGKTVVVGGLCCGLALCAASLFQQYGIMYTTVGKAGFITTLYIIMVPILGIFLKRRVPKKVFVAAIIAAAGMYLLCMSEKLSLGKGDILVFICALLFSVHIMVVDHFSPMCDGIELSCIQFFAAGVVATLGALIFEQPSLSGILAGILPLAYAGVMSSGVGYTLQVVAQKNLDPTIASLVMSLESVISVLAGWLFLHQVLTGRELLGCVLVFGAVILVQLPEKKKQQA